MTATNTDYIQSQTFIPDEHSKAIAKKVFGYTGNAFQIRGHLNYRLDNYWSEGSITKAALVSREGLQVAFPSGKTKNPMNPEAHQQFEIPPGHFVVEHRIYRGKDMGIRFVIRPDELDTFMLPAADSGLTEDEKIVIVFTQSLKSSYGGVSNYRFHEANRKYKITSDRWEAAKASLISKKLLNKAGAITQEGRVQGDMLRNQGEYRVS